MSAIPGDSLEIAGKLRELTGLYLSDGVEFGPGGEHHLRMNIACPRALCEDGAQRLIRGIKEMKGI